MKNSIFPILMLMVCWGCQRQDPNMVSFSGTIANPQSDQVEIYTIPPLAREPFYMATTDLDSMGGFQITLDIEGPTEVYFGHGHERMELYLEPGYNLNFKVDAQQFSESLLFEGQGATENNMLARVFLMEEELDIKYADIFRAPLDEFRTYLKDYESSTTSLYESVDRGGFSVVFGDYLDLLNDYWLVSSYFRYFNLNPTLLQNDELQLTEAERNYLQRIELRNSNLLDIRKYRSMLGIYVREITNKYYNEGELKDYVEAREKGLRHLLGKDLDQEVREYLLANNVVETLDFFGIALAEEGYEQFMAEFPNSRFAPLLHERYGVWTKLARGRPAPDFSGETPEGENVTLSSFRGKVVYIDVWATWCKPCLAELPYAKKLKKKFENESNVAFLYVSIDDTRKPWLKMLKKDPEFVGEHLFAENAWRSTIATEYMITGIPRYILIDQQGNIYDSNALRPSTGEKLAEEIRSLLNSSILP